ncbi:unnamed protein product [Caenorhabditis nigoni]
MSSESITTDVTTLKMRAMDSLINGAIQASNPSICPDDILKIAPLKITMKFAAADFFYDGVFVGTNMSVVCQAVARASWEITLDMVNDDANQGLQSDNHFIRPKPEEIVEIAAHAREVGVDVYELNYNATTTRGGAKVLLAVGFSNIAIPPPNRSQVSH